MTKRADILIIAVGQTKMITKEYVKEGAVVIDVGMDRDENGKLCGDVDYEGDFFKSGSYHAGTWRRRPDDNYNAFTELSFNSRNIN